MAASVRRTVNGSQRWAGTWGWRTWARDGRILIHHGFERIGPARQGSGRLEERRWASSPGPRSRTCRPTGRSCAAHGQAPASAVDLPPAHEWQTGRRASATGAGAGIVGGCAMGPHRVLECRVVRLSRSSSSSPPGRESLYSCPPPAHWSRSPVRGTSPQTGWALSGGEPGRPRRAFMVELPSGARSEPSPRREPRPFPGCSRTGAFSGCRRGMLARRLPRDRRRARELPYLLPAPACCPRPMPLRVSGDGRFLFVREGIAASVGPRGSISRPAAAFRGRSLFPETRRSRPIIRDIRLTPDGEGLRVRLRPLPPGPLPRRGAAVLRRVGRIASGPHASASGAKLPGAKL